jgi:hypothetical protein
LIGEKIFGGLMNSINYKSSVSGWEFSEKSWVVSLLNTGSKVTGHAMIVVEGIENDTLFVGQYEVYSKIIVDETISDVMQRTIGNSQGYISKIRVIENFGEFTRDYGQYSHKCWYAMPEDVRKMILSIKNAQQLIEQAIENHEDLPFKYQTAGSNRLSILGGNGGDSCVTWAESQLVIANIGNSFILADLIKAIPQLHTECVIS